LSPERARDPPKSPLNDSRDNSYNFSGIVVPPPPLPLEKTIPNFAQERKTDRQTDAKKPQRFLILQQLLDCHQIVFLTRRSTTTTTTLVPQNLNFLQILHKQDKAQAPPPPAGHKQIDAPQEFFLFKAGWLQKHKTGPNFLCLSFINCKVRGSITRLPNLHHDAHQLLSNFSQIALIIIIIIIIITSSSSSFLILKTKQETLTPEPIAF
jgi:hypothetical protein